MLNVYAIKQIIFKVSFCVCFFALKPLLPIKLAFLPKPSLGNICKVYFVLNEFILSGADVY